MAEEVKGGQGTPVPPWVIPSLSRYKFNKLFYGEKNMNVSLIITEVNYGATYADNSACHGYYVIIFFHIHIPFNKT